MSISPVIESNYPQLNDNQRQVVGHIDGPMLVIAGPGSGKTFSIVLRALNLLLLGIPPEQVILCTFTEKAAFEMRDRLASAARRVGHTVDLSRLAVSTIHGFCHRLLSRHRHRTPLGHNFETLDELTQLLFIFEHFDEIIGSKDSDGRYFGRWTTRWTAIEGARKYFDKITEEMVDPHELATSEQVSLVPLGLAYERYEEALRSNNRVDFSHLQRHVVDLLEGSTITHPEWGESPYLLVDEYQDTNYIQERLLLKLAGSARNLCVVGDEDQSLYRFRGATVRNILEFDERVGGCPAVQLTTNYRSHGAIVDAYDRWMASADWSNESGAPFRHDKTIKEDAAADHAQYPAVLSIWGSSARDEAERFADLVAFLKGEGVISDYNQIALLLHSVRDNHSGAYLKALQEKGIPAFCPRARAFFTLPEVREIVACYAVLFGWHGDARGDVRGAVARLARYVDDSIVDLGRRFGGSHPLAEALQEWTGEIAALGEGETLDLRPADYLYRMLALEPFQTALKDDNAARNLAVFSRLLNTFQNYYHYSVITHRNRDFIRFHFFNSFLRLLHDGGMNEYEDPDRPFPSGRVQVMTIHQAKGLEFPVVVVGSLSARIRTAKQLDRDLGPFYHRAPFEPENRITNFDRMRLHYVAFSRPQGLLALTGHQQPMAHFRPIWQGLPQWPHVAKDQLSTQTFESRDRQPVKKSYSFTGDLRIYETCPRQYQFFRDYDFTPSRSAVIFFGLLVHQSIEEIHRVAMDGRLQDLDEERIRDLFDRTFRFLAMADVQPVGERERETALRQVLNYFEQNRDEMHRIVETEVDVSIEKDGYILAGKVDLLLGGDGRLELLDFKTAQRPRNSPELLAAYERQLCTYAHILEGRYGKRVDRMLLYWTSEKKREEALMTLPYHPESVGEAGRHFDRTVRQIQAAEFRVSTPPEAQVCRQCDLRRLCRADGILPADRSTIPPVRRTADQPGRLRSA
ncbi:MAG: ATP-dependent helicase [Holophagales bacterium]|nr:ATP-dependent helicase [Holophagales bacterium]MYC10615.1 ATP-dependent helicase [Holophagales bacterium]